MALSAGGSQAPRCCPCSHSGRCCRYACVKTGNLCSSCIPNRLGNCHNLASDDITSRDNSLPFRTRPSVVPPPPSSDSPSPSSGPSIPDLPPYHPLSAPNFFWGSLDGHTCSSIIHNCYSEAILWKHNFFYIPRGYTGESFVKELSRLFKAYAEASALESIALKAAFLFPILILQRPSSRIKSKEVTAHIERRLALWQSGGFQELIAEGRTLQSSSKSVKPNKVTENVSCNRSFDNFMTKGNVKSAIRLLSQKTKGSFLHINDTVNHDSSPPQRVCDILRLKHRSDAVLVSRNTQVLFSNMRQTRIKGLVFSLPLKNKK